MKWTINFNIQIWRGLMRNRRKVDLYLLFIFFIIDWKNCGWCIDFDVFVGVNLLNFTILIGFNTNFFMNLVISCWSIDFNVFLFINHVFFHILSFNHFLELFHDGHKLIRSWLDIKVVINWDLFGLLKWKLNVRDRSINAVDHIITKIRKWFVVWTGIIIDLHWHFSIW
jgi:hypothetical protein